MEQSWAGPTARGPGAAPKGTWEGQAASAAAAGLISGQLRCRSLKGHGKWMPSPARKKFLIALK